MSSSLLRWVGPATMASSVALVYYLSHGTHPVHSPISATMLCVVFFGVYLAGVIPCNPLFPPAFFRANLFHLLYRLYCTRLVGYGVMRRVLHQSTPYPHSDYRYGVRCLRDCGLPLRPPPPPVLPRDAADRPVSAAAVVAAAVAAQRPSARSFYGRGGGVVDIAALSSAATSGVLVVPVPMFADNYAYLLVSLATRCVAAVDPADPAMVLRVMRVLRRQCGVPFVLTDVLTTHKHWDHAGGNATLRAYATSADNVAEANAGQALVSPELVVIGAAAERPLGCTRFVDDATGPFAVAGGGVVVRAVAVPGHTAGSVLYVAGECAPAVDDADDGVRLALFTGDSLFIGGYGAPFETTSVEQVLATRECFVHDPRTRTHPATGRRVRDADVLLYVGHEYTERLLGEVLAGARRGVAAAGCTADCRRFATSVADALREVKQLREASDGLEDVARIEGDRARRGGSRGGVPKARFRLPICTVPSTLEAERRTNPLLTIDPNVVRALQADGGELDTRLLESVIFGSPARQLPADDEVKPS